MRKISKSRPAFFLGLLGIIGTLMMYCIITRQDISYWKNDVTLWTRVIDLTPHSSETAYFLRSREYYLMGDYQKALDDADEAVKIAASKGSVLTPEIHLLLARIFKQLGKYDLALTAYTNAARLSPSPDRFSVYIAERGYLYLQMGRGDLANRDFIQAGATVQKK
jgi:tetratricopeptide (TPR) repeat protein